MACSLFNWRKGRRRLAADSALDPRSSHRAINRPTEIFFGSMTTPPKVAANTLTASPGQSWDTPTVVA